MNLKERVMFHQISWGVYFIAFAIIAGIYYAAVYLLFFNESLKDRCKSLSDRDRTNAVSNKDIVSQDENDYTTYQSLRDDMTAFLEASEPDMFKSDILFSLASIIRKYPALTDERFQEALVKEVRRVYLHKYNDGIEEHELAVLWQI